MYELDRLTEIFMPALPPARQRMMQGYKLIHYTSVETAEKILKHRSFRLGDTRYMNDVTEISHGLELVKNYLQRGKEARFLTGLDQLAPVLPAHVSLVLEQVLPRIREGVYASCVSEHSPFDDANGGRLPMWSLYGDQTRGVAFVLEPSVFWSRTNALNAYSTPVLYGHKAEFEEYADGIGERIIANIDFLRSIPLDQVLATAIIPVMFAALSTKSPSFYEEREWRVVHVPTLWPSAVLQRVEMGPNRYAYDVPLRDLPEQGLTGMEPDKLLVKIIVGPGNCEVDTIPKLLQAMTEAGVTAPHDRIVRSSIPLRR